MLCVSLPALVAFGHSSKADTVTSTVISETSEVISEETTVENQGAGVELHTTTTVTETTTISNQKTVGDEKTTGQYLTNRGFQTGNTNGWTVNQGTVQICATCGPFGGRALKTQGESTQGGTISQTVDLFSKMTQNEVQHGFKLNYGSHVHSDTSNATVPACNGNTTPDCRDTFIIGLTVKDSSGTVLHNFVHEFEEITFTGWNTNDFFFEQTIPGNEYTSAFATLALFGIDSGLQSGFHGPRFDNASLTATYNEVAFEQITAINRITSVTEELVVNAVEAVQEQLSTTNVVDTSETTVEPVDSFETETVEVFEITVTDNMTSMETTFEVSIDTNTEMTIEPIAVAAPVEVAEATVEEVTTEVEAQVAEATEGSNDISNNMEPSESSESNTSDSSSNDSTTDEPESQEDTSSNQDQPDEESSETKTAEVEKDSEEKDSGPKAKAKTKAKSKAELKREIAQKVVQTLVTRLGQSTADQATQVALMNLISADITANQPKLLDNTQWYQSEGVYQNQSVATNNKAQYFMFGGSDAKMNSLVDSQWK